MSVRVMTGDCRELLATLEPASVQTCVTSPPYYGLRDYGVTGQIGLERSVSGYVAELVAVFRHVRRVLADDGTVWLNLGDSYAGSSSGGDWREGSARADGEVRGDGQARRNRNGTGVVEGLKPKDLIGVPWRVAFALQEDGWWLRQDIIWHKPNPMPESAQDRCTKAHEYIFLLSKSERYLFDAKAIAEPSSGLTGGGWSKRYAEAQPNHGGMRLERPEDNGTRNKRSVWTVTTKPFADAHFATFPPALIEPCIKAGSRPGETVLDPFGGAGTTGLVSDRLGRNAVLIELNPEYAEMARRRISGDAPMFAELSA